MKRAMAASFGLACVLALAACAQVVSGNGSESMPVVDGARGDEGMQDPASPTAGRSGPLPDGGAASCVEAYSPQAVEGRSFAFDGEVLGVGPSVSDRGDSADLDLPGVTFTVREWFSGGRGDTVTGGHATTEHRL